MGVVTSEQAVHCCRVITDKAGGSSLFWWVCCYGKGLYGPIVNAVVKHLSPMRLQLVPLAIMITGGTSVEAHLPHCSRFHYSPWQPFEPDLTLLRQISLQTPVFEVKDLSLTYRTSLCSSVQPLANHVAVPLVLSVWPSLGLHV